MRSAQKPDSWLSEWEFAQSAERQHSPQNWFNFATICVIARLAHNSLAHNDLSLSGDARNGNELNPGASHAINSPIIVLAGDSVLIHARKVFRWTSSQLERMFGVHIMGRRLATWFRMVSIDERFAVCAQHSELVFVNKCAQHVASDDAFVLRATSMHTTREQERSTLHIYEHNRDTFFSLDGSERGLQHAQ